MPPESAAEPSEGVSRGELGASSLPPAGPTEPGGAASPAAVAPPSVTIGGDWPAQLTHKVEDVVSLIRDKTVDPVAKGVRYLIFGLLAAFLGITVVVLFAIFSIRVLVTEVPVFHTRVWAAYLVVAGIFAAAGLFFSRKRHSRS